MAEVAFNCVLVEFINVPVLCSCFVFRSPPSLHLSLSRLRAVCPYACCWLVSPFARTVVALSSSWALVRIYKQRNIWITHVKTERESESEIRREGERERIYGMSTTLASCLVSLLLLLLPHVNAQHLCLATFCLPALCTPIRRAGREREQKKITANSRAGI